MCSYGVALHGEFTTWWMGQSLSTTIRIKLPTGGGGRAHHPRKYARTKPSRVHHRSKASTNPCTLTPPPKAPVNKLNHATQAPHHRQRHATCIPIKRMRVRWAWVVGWGAEWPQSGRKVGGRCVRCVRGV